MPPSLPSSNIRVLGLPMPLPGCIVGIARQSPDNHYAARPRVPSWFLPSASSSGRLDFGQPPIDRLAVLERASSSSLELQRLSCRTQRGPSCCLSPACLRPHHSTTSTTSLRRR